MIKRLNYIHLALEIINFMIIPVVVIINGYDSPNVFIASMVCFMFVFPILNLVFTLIKESLVLEYDSSKFEVIAMGIIVLVGCLIWYLFYNLSFNYLNTFSLWFGCLLLAFIMPILICQIIEKYKENKSNNGPKFIRNGR